MAQSLKFYILKSLFKQSTNSKSGSVEVKEYNKEVFHRFDQCVPEKYNHWACPLLKLTVMVPVIQYEEGNEDDVEYLGLLNKLSSTYSLYFKPEGFFFTLPYLLPIVEDDGIVLIQKPEFVPALTPRNSYWFNRTSGREIEYFKFYIKTDILEMEIITYALDMEEATIKLTPNEYKDHKFQSYIKFNISGITDETIVETRKFP
jgi:hypothetical protein